MYTQSDLWTLPYEDLSDLLRRYPAMYPSDYGTLGAPLLFRPWNLHPWELRADLDGFPQNRRFDGLYESNLQPGNELDTIRLHFLQRGGAGAFDLISRSLKVDTPYTEFQIREGYYGYGTVDFMHGQRVYRTTTMEISGRLAWYDGLRYRSASRFTRIRGKVGFDLGSRWRMTAAWSGSEIKSDFTKNDFAADSLKYVPSREEGTITLAQRDSFKTSLDPSLRLYLREDDETWHSFRAHEMSGGWILKMHANLPRQRLTFHQTGTWARMRYPGIERRVELCGGLALSDSIGLGFGYGQVRAELRRESGWRHDRETDRRLLSDIMVRLETKPVRNISLQGGMEYTECMVPALWWSGSYPLAERPLLIAPEFADLSLRYDGSRESAPPVDRYVKTAAGFRWRRKSAQMDIQILTMKHAGDYATRFTSDGSSLTLVYDKARENNAQVGVSASAVIPLQYGLRLDSWWFAQAKTGDLSNDIDTRGYTRLFFEKEYFHAPLTVRSHISYEHIGRRWAYSDRGSMNLGPNHIFGFRISGTIRGVTLLWGTENILKHHYSYLPGYRMIAKEEYLAFIWRLWL
ncbi:hypothetical protein EHM69_06435 [candidate division KSB1 bacterium]|nr:MAG: hypothetical protein EHM69_06435 [candidate division KSB1 bacterium]